VNFDHPESLDFKRLAECLTELKNGAKTEIPIYDFVTHTRLKPTLTIHPTPIILVDGILIFHPEAVRSQFDHLIFFDTPESIRYERRLKRDVEDRGRTPDGVLNQFLKQVKPMHDQFVEPSRVHAHLTVKDLGEYDQALQETVQFCTKKILTAPDRC
jgi:uridine kinase